MRYGLWLALAALACESKPTLLGDVKAALAQRETKLQAWSFEASTGSDAGYTVVFRAPSSTRLELPNGTLSFDGQHFFERNDVDRTLAVHQPSLSAHELALLWSDSFGLYVPEGFRAPLLPSRDVTARAVAGTVELAWHTVDEGHDVSIVSVLRWPGADFLERRTDYGGERGAVRMEKEQCDEKLKLCVPTQLSRWEGEKKVETTTLKNVQLGELRSKDAFILTAPQGYAVSDLNLSAP